MFKKLKNYIQCQLDLGALHLESTNFLVTCIPLVYNNRNYTYVRIRSNAKLIFLTDKTKYHIDSNTLLEINTSDIKSVRIVTVETTPNGYDIKEKEIKFRIVNSLFFDIPTSNTEDDSLYMYKIEKDVEFIKFLNIENLNNRVSITLKPELSYSFFSEYSNRRTLLHSKMVDNILYTNNTLEYAEKAFNIPISDFKNYAFRIQNKLTQAPSKELIKQAEELAIKLNKLLNGLKS